MSIPGASRAQTRCCVNAPPHVARRCMLAFTVSTIAAGGSPMLHGPNRVCLVRLNHSSSAFVSATQVSAASAGTEPSLHASPPPHPASSRAPDTHRPTPARPSRHRRSTAARESPASTPAPGSPHHPSEPARTPTSTTRFPAIGSCSKIVSPTSAGAIATPARTARWYQSSADSMLRSTPRPRSKRSATSTIASPSPRSAYFSHHANRAFSDVTDFGGSAGLRLLATASAEVGTAQVARQPAHSPRRILDQAPPSRARCRSARAASGTRGRA